MDRDKLIQRLRGTFVAELQEHVSVFNRELLALEQHPNAELTAESIRVLFRTAHSLKGAARAVSATKLEGVCHTLEDLLAALRDGTRALTPEILATLFAAVDTFEETGRQFATGTETPPRPALAGVQVPPHFEAAVPAPAPAPPHSFPPPPAAREAANQNLAADALVRVPGRKLDGLLAQSGELLIARRRFDGRRAELAAVQDLLANVRSEWRSADTFLKRFDRGKKSNGARREPNDVLSTATLPRQAESALQSTRERLEHVERALDGLFAGMTEDMRTLDRVAVSLEEQIHKVRMLPFSHACDGLFRATRDLALEQDKEVELVIAGADTELDRSIIDGLRDPLLHVVRNAIDHGIETAEQRRAAGKPARATIRVAVTLRAEQAAITIEDDGQGIDVERVKAAARKQNLALAHDDDDVLRVIFEPGFSTAASVTHVSGRGVGLDVVKTQVEAMRGSVEVATEPGRSTAFTLLLPLTVTTLRVLFVRVGSEMFALPSSSVQRLVRAARSDIGLIEGREMLLLDAAPIPVVSLAELLGSPSTAAPQAQSKLPLVITRQQNQSVALAVDELLSEQDVLCKPLGERIARMRNISAATVLPTGRVALLLRPSDLVRLGVGRAPSSRAAAGFGTTSQSAAKRALLVDDSATTRTLERGILEAAGYEVLIAVDGKSAWLLLQEKGADIVVSDVEMPNMDGFALTEAIRASKRFRDLPVILLTSLDSAQDRARGMDSGANAYLVKSAFDQTNLLETIRQLL